MAIDPAPCIEASLHSFNRYALANDNPLRFTDPDGHAPTPLDAVFLIWDGLKLGVAIYTGLGVSLRQPTIYPCTGRRRSSSAPG